MYTFVTNSKNYAQTDYSTPFTFTITNTGINRFLSSQWSSLTTSWSGNYQGLDYSFTLAKPSISLTNNSIKIILTLSITSSVFSGTVTLTPTLTIPSTTLNAENIISQYENLHQVIISSAQLIDPRLRYVVEQALAPINWIIYQGKILNTTTTRLTETADVRLKGLPTLTFSVAENELNLIITPTITSTEPSISFQWMRSGNVNFGIRVISNNLFILAYPKIDKVIIMATGQEINFTFTSTVPVQATYDSTFQKYVAEFSFQSNNYIAHGQRIVTRIYLKRGGTETIWTLAFITDSDNQGWTYSNTEVVAIRGE